MTSSTTSQPELSPKLLAYIGDAVYELWVREALIHSTPDPEQLHQAVVSYVKAERQASVMFELTASLPEALQLLARRARNNTSPPKGRKIGQQAYREATALEAIIGHCHLFDSALLAALKCQILEKLELL